MGLKKHPGTLLQLRYFLEPHAVHAAFGMIAVLIQSSSDTFCQIRSRQNSSCTVITKPVIRHDPACSNTWRCSTTVSDAIQRFVMKLRWLSKHQQPLNLKCPPFVGKIIVRRSPNSNRIISNGCFDRMVVAARRRRYARRAPRLLSTALRLAQSRQDDLNVRIVTKLIEAYICYL